MLQEPGHPQADRERLPAFTTLLPRVLLIVFVIEAAVMAAFSLAPELHGPVETIVDATVLSLVSAPILWWWVVLPLRRRIEAQFEAARAMTAALAASEQVLQRQLERLRAMHRLSDALARGADTDAICREAVAGACEALRADRAAVLLFAGDGTLRFRAWEGLSDAYREAIIAQKPWEGLAPGVEFSQLPDVRESPLAEPVRALLRAEGVRALSAYPVRHEGRLLGILTMYWNEPHEAREEEARLGIAFARAIALVIDRARGEFELRRLAQAVDSSDDAIVLTDTSGKILRVNPAFERITGWSAPEALGRTPGLLRSGHAPDAFYAGMWRTILGGSVWSGRLVNRRKDGGEFHAWLAISPVFDDDGRLTSFVGVQRDVTVDVRREDELARGAARLAEANRELTLAKESAEDAARAKADFLATMSHEIRTPMNGVLGFAHLLADTPLDEAQRAHLEIIRSSGQSLLGIINDILDFSKIEAGRLEIERLPFDLCRAAREVAELLRPQAAGKGVGLDVAIEPGVPVGLVGDEGRVRQVLLNLAGNAVKFTEQGSVRIEVSAQAAGEDGSEAVRVAVIDTGIGIPADRQGALFQSFTQVDRSTTRRFGGTGLGLAICRRLVGLMGGQIGLDSEPGRGSTFWFTLPMPAGDVVLAQARPGSGPGARTFRLERSGDRPARVLVADDNSVNQKLVRHLLERAGCRVDVAGNGLEAVDMTGRIGYDLVLMDCRMPEMDGLEATRAIRAAESGRRIPIIALTASAMAEDREAALASGMDDFLAKPLQPEALHRCLERWAA